MMEENPKYENLTDNRTFEYGVSKELTDIIAELRKLADRVQSTEEMWVGSLRRGAVTWEDTAKTIACMADDIEHTMEFILEKFDQGVDKIPEV